MNDSKDSKKTETLQNFSYYILIALVLGVLAGLSFQSQAKMGAEIGKTVIQLIKMVTIPLVFLTIVTSILKTDINKKDAFRLFGFSLFNACIALTIGLLLSNFFKPGTGLYQNSNLAPATSEQTAQKIDLITTLKSYLPTSIVSPFQDNAIIPVVLLALALGISLKKVRDQDAMDIRPIEHLFDVLLKATEKVLYWIICLTPFAVFGVVAYAVGEHGFSPFKNLIGYVGVAVLGMTIHAIITQQAWVYFYAKIPLKKFWKEAIHPVTYSIGTNSSLATLPVTLKALKNLGVSHRASSLGACVGTNLNNDGIILYEAMAVLFVAQANGIDMSLTAQIVASFFCLVAAMGVAGVPEAGFISLSLVLTTVGMPAELLPLLLTVDWVVARARSASNVLSDMVLSINIDQSIKGSRL